MTIHGVKCRLGLHDWQRKRDRYDDIVLIEKDCLWCAAEKTAVEYASPATVRG